MTVVFDTLSASKKFQKAGMTRSQEKVQVEALAGALENFVTKQDLREAVVELRGEMKESELRLESKIEKLEMKLTIKLGAMLVAAVGLIVTLVKIL